MSVCVSVCVGRVIWIWKPGLYTHTVVSQTSSHTHPHTSGRIKARLLALENHTHTVIVAQTQQPNENESTCIKDGPNILRPVSLSRLGVVKVLACVYPSTHPSIHPSAVQQPSDVPRSFFLCLSNRKNRRTHPLLATKASIACCRPSLSQFFVPPKAVNFINLTHQGRSGQ